VSLTLDLSADLLVCNNLRTMTLKVEGQADVALTACVLDEPFLVKEMEPSKGQVPQTDLRLHWPASRSAKPPLGSVLVDDAGTYWTILTVEYRDVVQTYAARCRNLSIVSAADNTATILKAVYGKGAANEAAADWLGVFSLQSPPTEEDKVPARFQPSAEMAELFLGAEWTRMTYRVIFNGPMPMETAGGEYRLVDKERNRYRVIKYLDEERIDRLPVAIAVRITEGAEHFHP